MTSSFPGIDPMRYATAQAQWIEPFAYQEHVRGKQVRTELAWALSALYRLPAHQTHVLCTAVERMNVASLIHDDLLDGDCLRRGIPAVWKRYGASVALVSGMYGYLAGLRGLTELNDLGVLRAGLKCLESLHIGQYLDTQISEGAVLPSLEEYGFVAQANTGCFFVFLLDACQCLKPLDHGVHAELEALLYELGVYYRYVNDYCDINHIPHFEKKGFATDLEGGPKSFLMILANQPLVKGARTAEQKNAIIRALGKAGVFDAALALMEDTYHHILQCLGTLRQLDCGLNSQGLEGFVRDVHFEPGADDNYYERMLA
ncbi:polyprenyl synthetase family protein [Pseudomonas sp. 18.1.10]|uniref:polyprenyl synthetase family protein n=1 Tax=Pseudomonas sp. 18.1.10 TaxID=2969302 RepID=UPI0021505D7E|nr:polyprenyl synthetase family protein [Pseudomonas sp. 18.1.10]MCR4538845.1 polyprenyl synthetase family protein [Pseudomonas sp. 18.1.10]